MSSSEAAPNAQFCRVLLSLRTSSGLAFLAAREKTANFRRVAVLGRRKRWFVLRAVYIHTARKKETQQQHDTNTSIFCFERVEIVQVERLALTLRLSCGGRRRRRSTFLSWHWVEDSECVCVLEHHPRPPTRSAQPSPTQPSELYRYLN